MEDDQLLVEILLNVENEQTILLHSPGGTGKSHILRAVATFLVKKGKKIACTAATGIAAINLSVPEVFIAGSTIHSWAGVGLADHPPAKLVARVTHDERARKRWLETDLLIIDEVSMLGADLIDKLDYVGRNIRRVSDKPFGGIQLIFSGDFLQLPPVKDKWAFQGIVWREIEGILTYVTPYEPKRYEDRNWFEMLLRFRKSRHTLEDIKFLRTRFKAYEDWLKLVASSKDTTLMIKPTVLNSKKIDVDFENDQELEKLKGPMKDFIAIDEFNPRNHHARAEHYIKQLDDAIPKYVYLKVGAQVMLKANLDLAGGLANGSRGVVIEILDSGVKVKWKNGTVTLVSKHTWIQEDKDGRAIRNQIPLILAWSLTIHKCVSGDTLVSTTKGIVYMKNLTNVNEWGPLKLSVATRKGWENTSQIYKGEKEPSFILKTRMGYTLEGSERHPVLVRVSDGREIWKKLPEIEIGDVVVMRYNFGCDKTEYIDTGSYWKDAPLKYITEDLGYMIGLLVGDGSYVDTKDGTVDFSNSDQGLLDAFSRLAESLLGVRVCSYGPRRYFCRKEVRNFLFASGLEYSKGPVKKVPWIVLQSPQSVQKAFIRGLFDTDGGVNKTCIHFTSSSPILTKEMHVMLLSIGVISRRYEMPNEKAGAWRIEITGEDQRYWQVQIGFDMTRKQLEYEKYSHTGTIVPKSNVGTLPDTKFIAEKLRETYQLSEKNGTTGLIARCIRGTSRLHFRHIPFLREQLALEETDIGRHLCEIMDGSFFYDPVVSVERGECEMYDFEVPGSNSFVTNGIVSHNCQGCTLDYAICNLGPSIFCPGQAYVALSRVRSSDGLFLSEFYPAVIKADENALEYVERIEQLASQQTSKLFEKIVYELNFIDA